MMHDEKDEKADQQPADEGSLASIKAKFQAACYKIWKQHVCPALIFGRSLQICLGCMAFWNEEDLPVTHPEEKMYSINKLCLENFITTQESLFNYLWKEVSKLAPSFGYILMPRVSKVHIQSTCSSLNTEKSLNRWNQSRINLLEQEMTTMRADNIRLLAILSKTEKTMSKIKEILEDWASFKGIQEQVFRQIEVGETPDPTIGP